MSRATGLRVLLAGDGGEFATTLRSEGHTVTAARNSTSALGAAESCVPDVVIVDLEQLDGDPFALAKHVRRAARWHKPMVIAISHRECATCDARLREAGVDLLLVKPVEAKLLTGFLGRLWSVVRDFESFDPMI
jgi:DNA-binding response OmpR family regulator